MLRRPMALPTTMLAGATGPSAAAPARASGLWEKFAWAQTMD